MNEFALIDQYFTHLTPNRRDVLFGIGDDAACLMVPQEMHLLVSTDTLVSGVHFLPTWDPYDIAIRAVMVNVSDMAAMGAAPAWMLLALTLPKDDSAWLHRFSEGLRDALLRFDMTLIGGDTTKGPLSMTLTIHGFSKRPVRRCEACVGDLIYVSGELGAAALAVTRLPAEDEDQRVLMKKLLHPNPRVDLAELLQAFATSAIDISDGLSADLNHICESSHVGASLELDKIPVHSLVRKYKNEQALEFALAGGDDYELCFTIPKASEAEFLSHLTTMGLSCHRIGWIKPGKGLFGRTADGSELPIAIKGYSHFE